MASTLIQEQLYHGYHFPAWDPYANSFKGINAGNSPLSEGVTKTLSITDPTGRNDDRKITYYCFWKHVETIVCMNIKDDQDSLYSKTKITECVSSESQTQAFAAEVGFAVSGTLGVEGIATATVELSTSLGFSSSHTESLSTALKIEEELSVALKPNSVFSIFAPCVTYVTDTGVKWTVQFNAWADITQTGIDLRATPQLRISDGLTINLPGISKTINEDWGGENGHIDLRHKSYPPTELTVYEQSIANRQRAVYRHWSRHCCMQWSILANRTEEHCINNYYHRAVYFGAVPRYLSCKEMIMSWMGSDVNPVVGGWDVVSGTGQYPQYDTENQLVLTNGGEGPLAPRIVLPTTEINKGLMVFNDRPNHAQNFEVWSTGIRQDWATVAAGGVPPTLQMTDAQELNAALGTVKKELAYGVDWSSLTGDGLSTDGETEHTLEFSLTDTTTVSEETTNDFSLALGIAVSASGSFEFGSVGTSMEATYSSMQSIKTSTENSTANQRKYAFTFGANVGPYAAGVQQLKLTHTVDGIDLTTYSNIILQWDTIGM